MDIFKKQVTIILVFIACLLCAACEDDISEQEDGVDSCVVGTVNASQSVQEQSDVGHYEFNYDESKTSIVVEVFSQDDASLGTLNLLDFDFLSTEVTSISRVSEFVLGSYTAEFVASDESRVTVERQGYLTSVSQGHNEQHARITIDGESIEVWLHFSDAPWLIRAAVAVPADEIDAPELETQHLGGFGEYYVYEIESVDENLSDLEAEVVTEFEAWMEQVDRSEFLDSEAFQYLGIVDSDSVWKEALFEAIADCEEATSEDCSSAITEVATSEGYAIGTPVCSTAIGCLVIVGGASATATLAGRKGNDCLMPEPDAGCDDTLCADTCAQAARACEYFAGSCEDGEGSENKTTCKCEFQAIDDCSESIGDPHITTFDGLAYDFQSVGEFVLMESIEETQQSPQSLLQVQARTALSSESKCPSITYNTAVATQVGPHQISLYAGDPGASDAVYIDGAPVALTPGFDSPTFGDHLTRPNESTYRITWATGEVLDIRFMQSYPAVDRLDIQMHVPEHRKDTLQGIWGTFDGSRDEDMTLRDGTVLEQPILWTDLYGVYSDSWRIEAEESLFEYSDGENTDDHTDRTLPIEPLTIDSLPDEDREEAEQLCTDGGVTNESAFEDCVIDVACTEDPTYVEVHAGRDFAKGRLEILPPGFGIDSELAEDNMEAADGRILWTFTDDTTEPHSFPDSVEVSGITDPNELPIFEVTDRYNYPNSPIFRFAPHENTPTLVDAYEGDEYVEFDITPTEDPVQLARFYVSMARGADIGNERGLQLRSSLDDFTRVIWYDEVLTNRPDIERFEVPLSHVELTETTTFRLYLNTPGSRRTIEIGDMAFDVE